MNKTEIKLKFNSLLMLERVSKMKDFQNLTRVQFLEEPIGEIYRNLLKQIIKITKSDLTTYDLFVLIRHKDHIVFVYLFDKLLN